MAKGASTINIKQCATYLIKEGCPLMPLTNNKNSPFDIAEIYHNTSYECVKIFFQIRQYNNINPIEVSSRNEAKTILSRLACPNVIGKITLIVKNIDITDCLKNDGLFLLYKTNKSRHKPNEFGLCVYNAGQVFVYPIVQKHMCTINDLKEPLQKYIYKYSLITDTIKDDRTQLVLFRSCDELIYNHTKYKGILPTVLKNYIGMKNGEIEILNGEVVILKGSDLLIPNQGPSPS